MAVENAACQIQQHDVKFQLSVITTRRQMKNCTMPTLYSCEPKATPMRFRTSVLSLAAVLALAGMGSNAYALGFGQMRVKSALGQPLEAEVELTDAQAASLKAGMAPAQVYQDKGLDYNPVVKNVRTSLRRNANGRMVLHLSSDRPVNDPFVDVVLQANDGSSSIVRDFSILLDPPVKTRSSGVIAPAVSPADVEPVVSARVAKPKRESVTRQSGVQEFVETQAEKRVATRSSSEPMQDGSVRVRRGATAGQIAMNNRPAHVSLDQMLVALVKANSHAFINGNVNHLKSGVVLKMPTAQQASEVSAAEARTIIIAQSEDFRSYRTQLAKSSMVQAAPGAQQSSGKVQTQVLDAKTSPAVAPDQLTISNAGVEGKKQTKEDRVAKALENRDKLARAEELNKNLADLKNISAEVAATSSQGTGKGNAPGSAPVVITAPVPGMQPNAGASSEVPPASAAASQTIDVASQSASQATEPASAAEEAASMASAPQQPASVVKPPVKPQPAPEPAPEPSFLDSLLENPIMLGGGVTVMGLVAMLLLRMRKKRQSDVSDDSTFAESNITTGDSFFHASGGASVDTSESVTANLELSQSSMLYSPSQLDVDSDVDPVSEADVYLAYGRDIQAEEILKDAIVKYPGRVSIYVKLLEIYERRRDIKSYAQTAAEIKSMTQAEGADWEGVRIKGSELDPGNPLYAPSQEVVVADPVESVELDANAFAQPNVTSEAVETADEHIAAAQLSPPTLSPSTVPVTIQTDNSKANDNLAPIDLSLDLSAISSFDLSEENAAKAVEAITPKFDMGDLSLDLETPAAEPVEQVSEADDELVTKLALAREFLSFGDNEGARAMAQEVAQNATGDLQAQAQALIQSIS